MSEKIELELKLKGGDKAVKTLGQLEQELNDARDAIKEVEVGSDAFKNLATKIQKTSSEVKTLEKQMEGLEPQQKAEAFLKMGEGIAGGFAVAQGAMGLMGIESEDLEKIQVKVQSAIAIAQGVRMMSEAALMAATAKRVAMEKIAIVQSKLGKVTALASAAANWIWTGSQAAITVAVSSTTIALAALRTAIIATGIGALVVGVVALVSSITSWIASSKEQSATQEELNDALLKENKAILDNIDLQREKDKAESEEAVRLIELREARENQAESIERNNEAIEKNNELMKEGVSKKLQKKLIDENERRTAGNKIIKDRINLLWSETDAVQSTIDTYNDLSAAEQKILDDKEAKRKERADKRKSDAAELISLQEEVSLLLIEDEDKRNKAKLELDKQHALDKVANATNSREQILLINQKYDQLELERLETQQEKIDAHNQKIYDAWEQKQKDRNEVVRKSKEKQAADELKLEEKVAEFKDGLGAQSFELARQLGGKNEKIQKGIAVAETIFNTQKAVMRAVADIPAPYGLVQAGIHGAMGAVAIKNILSENMGGVEGGGATTEPMTPASTGAFSLGGAIEQEPVKAYVVTDEMSDSQAQLAEIRRRTIL